MRRKEGTLLPLEVAILETGMDLRDIGEPEFHGFLIAKAMGERAEARRLTAHGTLYKALNRMERAGLLTSRWEDPDIAAEEGRPRRRLYHVTAPGERAFAGSIAGRSERETRPSLGWVST